MMLVGLKTLPVRTQNEKVGHGPRSSAVLTASADGDVQARALAQHRVPYAPSVEASVLLKISVPWTGSMGGFQGLCGP